MTELQTIIISYVAGLGGGIAIAGLIDLWAKRKGGRS